MPKPKLTKSPPTLAPINWADGTLSVSERTLFWSRGRAHDTQTWRIPSAFLSCLPLARVGFPHLPGLLFGNWPGQDEGRCGCQGTRGAGGASVSGGTRSTEVRVAVRKVGDPRKITTEKYLTEKSRKDKGDGVSLGSEEETGVFVL